MIIYYHFYVEKKKKKRDCVSLSAQSGLLCGCTPRDAVDRVLFRTLVSTAKDAHEALKRGDEIS